VGAVEEGEGGDEGGEGQVVGEGGRGQVV